ncbi:peptidoglycan DD-metalloendopeptidase family protein [Stappia sp. GBMRC 2046]|uniref:Peptidoglycan DD-metalloendopeptidase family protein n=1 Tax=Stappia sediminis TaxID=2692190 RepID=A0A7X3S5Y5_9HYPH|nr:M23/M56 family metallopeptidase [Stappia sediminis]MXN63569.1 peptidoglycan DD-metalloendopeptidase family protein [Stappia sediminis]
MTMFLAALAFSLVWGGVLRVGAVALTKAAPSLRVSPSFHLALIVSLVVPVILMLAGIRLGLPVLPALQPLSGLSALQGGIALHAPAEMQAGLAHPRPSFRWQTLCAGIAITLYVFGAAVHLLRLSRTWQRLSAIAANATPDPALPRSAWPVGITHTPIPAFVIAGWRRSIVLPQALVLTSSPQQLAMIVAHEEAHLKARDPEVAAALSLIVAIFWFNPFARALAGRWRLAAELRADAAALDKAPKEMRRAYARILLSALRIPTDRVMPCPPATFSTLQFRTEKMRMTNILEGRFPARKSRFSFAFAAAFSLALTGVGASLATSSLAGPGAVDIVKGRLAVSFGVIRKDGTFHKGVDIAAPIGTPIFTPEDMIVVEASDLFRGEPRYGKGVELRSVDGTRRALFTHVDSYSVNPGDRLKKGEAFATVGKSGSTQRHAHLHLEAFENRRRVDPVSLWPQLRN